MRSKNQPPKPMIRLTRNGFEPCSPYDYELLSELQPGTVVEIKVVEKPQSAAMKAWWLLCSRTAKALDSTHTSRSISNEMLINMSCVSLKKTHGGGEIHEPMSLTEFSESQLWRLFEAAKLYVYLEIIPGVDIDELLRTDDRSRRY